MRDRRFVAGHRGGLLDLARHRLLAGWAADCAERVVPLFERVGGIDGPRRAIEIGREWARGEVKTGVAQRAAWECHAAARAVEDPAAVAAARAVGHAVATAHFADHSLGSVIYGVKAVQAAWESAGDEFAWQMGRIPDAVRELVTSGLELRCPELVAKLRAS